MIRPALSQDAPAIARLINDAAEYGLMLHRSLSGLYDNLRDYQVAVETSGEQQEQIVGVCGLKVVWSNLAEVYALVVAPDQRGQGLGKKLVESCVLDARRLGVRKLMTLTYEQRFFENLGFVVMDRKQLPLKVWSECLRCAKNTHCDEIAMMRVLEEVPNVTEPKPLASPTDQYQVPVQLQMDAPLRRLAKREKMDEL